MRGGGGLRALLIVLVAVAVPACLSDDEQPRAASSSVRVSEPHEFPLPDARSPRGPTTPVAAACADVLEALTDAVIRYETAALAEGAGSGSRSGAAAEMLALVERARAAAGSQAGMPPAAAPAIDAVIALRDGLDSRATLDEEDAAPWRAPRDDLQVWCAAQG